MNVIPETRCAH